jgi:hypothetical protein
MVCTLHGLSAAVGHIILAEFTAKVGFEPPFFSVQCSQR